MGNIFFLVLLILISADSIANPNSAAANSLDGKQSLLNTSKAMKSLNYQGTVVFLRNGKLETMKYFHAANNDAEQERLVSLNSPLREIVRDSSHVSCHFKATEKFITDYRPYESSFLLEIPANIEQLTKLYSVDIIGEEDIAMQPAFVLALQPKDKLRYIRKIWIGKKYFLPLKAVIYDFSGSPLEQLVFTEQQVVDSLPFVNLKSTNKAPVPENQKSGQLANSAQVESQSTFIVNELPQGFQSVFFTRSPVHNSDQPVDHMVLSDGLSSVSIYMENKNTTTQTGLQTIGAVNLFSKIIGDFELTVMGEVPAETIKLIVDGIKLRQESH